MTTTPNTPLSVTLTLDKLDGMATFAAYLRLETTDSATEGFGLEGAVRVAKTIDREAWEALGSPVVLAVVLRSVSR